MVSVNDTLDDRAVYKAEPPATTSDAQRCPHGAALATAAHAAVVTGELVAIAGEEGQAYLVTYSSQPRAVALRARSVVDLHAEHIGRLLVLAFENGDPERPIVMGLLQTRAAQSVQGAAGLVEVDNDGERIVVSAKDRLVLRCGKARITLTKAGKVIIEGTYVHSRSNGVNRVSGGSVHLN